MADIIQNLGVGIIGIVIVAIIFLSERFFKKQPIMIGTLLTSTVFLILLRSSYLEITTLHEYLGNLISNIDASNLLNNLLLGSMLYIIATNIDLNKLFKQKLKFIFFGLVGPILTLIISTFILYYTSLGISGFPVSGTLCLLLCLIIGTTDLIPSISVQNEEGVSKNITDNIISESLTSNSIGLFGCVAISALLVGNQTLSFENIFNILRINILPSLMLGIAMGFVILIIAGNADNYIIELITSIGVIVAIYFIGNKYNIPTPISMLISGLFAGYKKQEKSDVVYHRLFGVWELSSIVIQTASFVIITLLLCGQIKITATGFLVGIICYGVLLVIRYLLILMNVLILKSFKQIFDKGTINIMSINSIHGAIALSLALSIPDNIYKDTIVTAVCVACCLSILLQVGFLKKLARHVVIKDEGGRKKDPQKDKDEKKPEKEEIDGDKLSLTQNIDDALYDKAVNESI